MKRRHVGILVLLVVGCSRPSRSDLERQAETERVLGELLQSVREYNRAVAEFDSVYGEVLPRLKEIEAEVAEPIEWP